MVRSQTHHPLVFHCCPSPTYSQVVRLAEFTLDPTIVALALPLPKWYAMLLNWLQRLLVALALPLPKWYANYSTRN